MQHKPDSTHIDLPESWQGFVDISDRDAISQALGSVDVGPDFVWYMSTVGVSSPCKTCGWEQLLQRPASDA